MGRKSILQLFICVLVVFFLSTCRKQENEFSGSASALKNGLSWNAECISGYDRIHSDEIFIFFRSYSDEGFLREDLGVSRIPLEIGNKTIIVTSYDSITQEVGNNSANYATLIDDGDVLDKYYNVLETENNFVDIKSINYDQMLISGSFEITFVLSDTLSEPDTIRFVGGEFEAEIREDW